MAKNITITGKAWQSMRRHVGSLSPLEACGLLTGKNSKVERSIGIFNADRSPVRFRMEPRAQWRAFQRMEAEGRELVGIYHSHPNGPDRLSPTDIAEAMYPVAQIVWYRLNGRWQARGFRIEGQEAIELVIDLISAE